MKDVMKLMGENVSSNFLRLHDEGECGETLRKYLTTIHSEEWRC